MDTVNATELKNRLGAVLARAATARVAIVRHGRVVAYLTPVAAPTPPSRKRQRVHVLSRHEEARLARLCASGDLRPSRWRRAGDARTLAGVAMMMATADPARRPRWLALAEALHPGMSEAAAFGRWLEGAPVQAARFLPTVAMERQHLGQ